WSGLILTFLSNKNAPFQAASFIISLVYLKGSISLFSLSVFYTIVVYTIVEFYKFEWRYIYGKVDKNLL
ncbi:MAG: hypothetical protein EGR13_09200, partial [Coprococcus comes]|nr:hypothetical protein [Coprococcus comes]